MPTLTTLKKEIALINSALTTNSKTALQQEADKTNAILWFYQATCDLEANPTDTQLRAEYSRAEQNFTNIYPDGFNNPEIQQALNEYTLFTEQRETAANT